MKTREISFKRTSQFGAQVIGIFVIVFLSVYLHSTAFAGPKTSLSIATDRIGTSYNAIGSGFAKVISQYSKITVVVRPFSGPEAWLPAVNNGEIELGAMSPFSAWQTYNAVGFTTPLTNFRLLRSGKESLKVAFCVTKKSGIKTIKDLKGKRVASNYGGHGGSTMRAILSELKTEGLDWADVVQIPVTGINDGTTALGEDRVDVCWASVGQPSVRELDIKLGVRYLPVKDDPKSVEILRQYGFPGIQVVTVKRGSAPGILEDIPVMTYDSYLIAWADLDDETITSILNTLWDHTNDLFPIHPSLANFTKEVAVTTLPVIPYHPSSIRFYKEKGVWKDEANKIQK